MDSHYAYFVARVYDLFTKRLTSPGEPKEWSPIELVVHIAILTLFAWHTRDLIIETISVIKMIFIGLWQIRIGISPL
jgi:hypothetical protein